MNQAVFDDAVTYYGERYEVVARYPLVAAQKIRLQDHFAGEPQHCRFCGCGAADTSFSSVAHAVPEFLGNRDVLSLNECDRCNAFLASSYEDHLSKWSLFARAVSQVRGKRSKPTFKNANETLRVGSGKKGLEIAITDPNLMEEILKEGGPFTFDLPVDASSQPHVPLRAALAIVKIACSICPAELMNECKPAIDWLMGRTEMKFSSYPVLYAFTPGPIGDDASEVMLVKRTVDEPIPYLWCVVQFSNYRLQTFVPCCPSDAAWLRMGEQTTFGMRHFPTRFGPNWPYGPAELSWGDWSCTELVRRSAKASFHADRAIRMDDGERCES